MSALLWIGGGILGGLALKRVFSTPAVGGTAMTTQAIEKTVLLNGRVTYLHAPAGANRILVFFQGFGGSASGRGPALAKALGDQRVALVVPQLGPKSEPGGLETGFSAYLAAVRSALGLEGAVVDGAAHSGGYRALALALGQAPFRAIGLLDAFYGQYDVYLNAARAGRCLIDIYGPTTAPLSEQLQHDTVGRSNVQVLHTTTAHDAVPEKYLGDMVRSFDGCRSMTVS